jgi:hypothetical protein
MRSMTDFGASFRSSDDFSALRDRVAAARAQARLAAEEYVQLRRRAEASRTEALELCAQAARLSESLRESVAAYVSMLRQADVPPERAIVMVKGAMCESDPLPDKHQRHVVEEVVRWAVDAYYAA